MVLCSSTRLFSLACKPGICWSPRFTSHAFLIPDSDLFKFEAGTVLAFWLRKDKVFRNDSITNLNSDRLVCRCSPGGRFGPTVWMANNWSEILEAARATGPTRSACSHRTRCRAEHQSVDSDDLPLLFASTNRDQEA